MKSFKKILSKTSILFLALCLLIPGVNSLAAAEKKEVSISATTTFSDLERMTNIELISYIVNNLDSAYDIEDLTDQNSAISFYSDQTRAEALLDGIVSQAPSWSETNDAGLSSLIRLANYPFYLSDDPTINYTDNTDYRAKVTDAIIAILDNPRVAFNDSEAAKDLFEETSYLFYHAPRNGTELYTKLGHKIRDFIDDFDYYYSVYTAENDGFEHGLSAYSQMIEAIDVNLYNNRPWESNVGVDYLMEQITRILFEAEEHYVTSQAVKDTMWYLQWDNLGQLHTDADFALNQLVSAYNSYGEWDTRKYFAGVWLYWNHNGQDAAGNVILTEDPSADFESVYLPEEYSFDNGSFIIRAGSNVPNEKIQELYWAAKEVQAQMHRLAGVDVPVDGTGNADDVITAIVYNNKTQYDSAEYMFGIGGTNNGGKYIEQDGTLYTYDREVPLVSSFKLEELFRHEYTHAIVSKYIISGIYNETPLFWDNNWLRWYGEGIAEYLAGSTRTSIERRETMMNDILTPPTETGYFTVEEVLNADGTYGFSEYDYFYAFFDFAMRYNNGQYADIITEFSEILSDTDTDRANVNYQAYVNELSANTTLNADFQAHLQDMIRAYNNGEFTRVLVPGDYTANHSLRSLATIENDISSINGLNLTNVTISTDNSSRFFDTFTLRGTYRGNGSNGADADKLDMDNLINQALANLEGLWSGYNTVSGYFVDYQVINGDYQFDLVFHGLYTGEDITPPNNISPVAVADVPTAVEIGEIVTFDGSSSHDNDGTIVSYQWDFNDGSTSSREIARHSFSDAGIYEISLTVTDDQGAENTDSVTVTVRDIVLPENVESEPNNRKSDADSIQDNIDATLDADTGDHTDWFTFDVVSNGDVTIDVTSIGGDFNVEVEDENGVVVARPLRDNIVNLPAGTYYIIAYTWAGYPVVDYTISISSGTVITNDPPVAFAESSVLTADVGQSISFNAERSSDSDGTILSYEWNFDDGSTSTQTNPTHSFVSEGTFNVSLTVTDDQGASNTDTITITVGSTPPPGIILDETGTLDSTNAGVNYYFTASGSGTTTITLTSSSADDAITWVLYEAASGERVDWASQNGNVHEKTMNLNPGTEYEISIYTWDTLTINYDIVITE
ncbi:PKD domain-containing protein [Chengkuizengella axinellae]|uniref:PKD domain-containing protein n=1 Tax=Chengkuizengella axinellae TaxID=3064388 RepID=A0ABT9IUV8_9BACL|nr:PKD domain-containing protein [Chengkuizengella sp. 2205SS18-9]MDP5273143.1 PKD domain-containing protein [Chengkuizengella sp. 2205SS18-9]